jgi:hypothetical protein
VNFGGGQVWYFSTRKACADYITQARLDARDPYAGLYFIERRDPDTGEWFRSRGKS